MIERYQSSFVSAAFSDGHKYTMWRRIEIAAMMVEEDIGSWEFEKMAEYPISISGIRAIEAECHHDVMAFVAWFEGVVGENWPKHARFLHKRLTSSDVVDTANAMVINHLQTVLRASACALANKISNFAAHNPIPVAGRTHGQIALPMSSKDRLDRIVDDLVEWYPKEVPGKLGGPMGLDFTDKERNRFSHLLESVHLVGRSANQCVSRHWYVAMMQNLSLLSGILEQHATNLRLWMIDGVHEYDIVREADHTASSSMPHKNNPIELEKVCGLSRLVRGYALAISESACLWHERDISHSCVERVAIEDTFHCIFHQLDTMSGVFDKLRNHPQNDLVEKARKSERIRIMALADIDDGMSRLEAWKK